MSLISDIDIQIPNNLHDVLPNDVSSDVLPNDVSSDVLPNDVSSDVLPNDVLSQPDVELQLESDSQHDVELQINHEPNPDVERQLEAESQLEAGSHPYVEQQLEGGSHTDVELLEAESEPDVELQLEDESEPDVELLEAESEPDVELLEAESEPDVELQLEDESEPDVELLEAESEPDVELLEAESEPDVELHLEDESQPAFREQNDDESSSDLQQLEHQSHEMSPRPDVNKQYIFQQQPDVQPQIDVHAQPDLYQQPVENRSVHPQPDVLQIPNLQLDPDIIDNVHVNVKRTVQPQPDVLQKLEGQSQHYAELQIDTNRQPDVQTQCIIQITDNVMNNASVIGKTISSSVNADVAIIETNNNMCSLWEKSSEIKEISKNSTKGVQPVDTSAENELTDIQDNGSFTPDIHAEHSTGCASESGSPYSLVDTEVRSDLPSNDLDNGPVDYSPKPSVSESSVTDLLSRDFLSVFEMSTERELTNSAHSQSLSCIDSTPGDMQHSEPIVTEASSEGHDNVRSVAKHLETSISELPIEQDHAYAYVTEADPPSKELHASASIEATTEMEQNSTLATQSDLLIARCTLGVLVVPHDQELSITEIPAQLDCKFQSVIVNEMPVISRSSVEAQIVDSAADVTRSKNETLAVKTMSNNPWSNFKRLATNGANDRKYRNAPSHAKSHSEEKLHSMNDDVPLVSETLEAFDKGKREHGLYSIINKEIIVPTSHDITSIGQSIAARSTEINCRSIEECCILKSDASSTKPCKPMVLDSKVDDNGTPDASSVSAVPAYLCKSVSATVILSDTEPDDNKSNSDVLSTLFIIKKVKAKKESFTNIYHHPKGKGISRCKQSYKINNSVITTINKNVKSLLASKLRHSKDTKKLEGLKQSSISEYMMTEDTEKHFGSNPADDVFPVKLTFAGDAGSSVNFVSTCPESNKDVIWITDESTGEVCSLNTNQSACHFAKLAKTCNSTQKQTDNKYAVNESHIDSGNSPTNTIDHGNLQDNAKLANYPTIVDQTKLNDAVEAVTQSKDDKIAVLSYYQDQLPKHSTLELASKPNLAFPVHVYCHSQESDNATFNDGNNEAMYPGNFTLSGNPSNYDKSTTGHHEDQVAITDTSSAGSHPAESSTFVEASVFPVALVQHSVDANSLSSVSHNVTTNACQIAGTHSNNVTCDQTEQSWKSTVNILQPFHCDQGLCMEKFETANMLVDHVEKMHSGPESISINIFKCNKCMFSTNVQSCIDNHMFSCQKTESESPNLINGVVDFKIKTDEVVDLDKATLLIVECLMCKGHFRDHGDYFQHVCENHIRCNQDVHYCPFCNFGICFREILLRHMYFTHFDVHLPPDSTLKKLWQSNQYYDPFKPETDSAPMKQDMIESEANDSNGNKNSENKVSSSSGGERPITLATVKMVKGGKGRGRLSGKQKTMQLTDKGASCEEKVTSTVSFSPPGEIASDAYSFPTGKKRPLRKSTTIQTKASKIMESKRLSTDLKAKKNGDENSKTPVPAIEGICKSAEQEDNIHDKLNAHQCSTRCVSKLKPEYELPNVDCYLMKYCSAVHGYFVCEICHASNNGSMGLLRSHIFDVHLKLTPYRCSKCEYSSICYFAVEKHLKTEHSSSKHSVLMELSEFQHDKIQQRLKAASNSTGKDVRKSSCSLVKSNKTEMKDKESSSSRIKIKKAEKDGKEPISSQSQEVACNSEAPSEPAKDINSFHSSLTKVHEKKEDKGLCIYVVSSDDEAVCTKSGSVSDNEGDTVSKAAGKSSDSSTSQSADSQSEIQSPNNEQNSTDELSTETDHKPIAVVNANIPESIQNLQMVFPNLTKPLEACYVPVSKKKFGCRLCRLYTSMFWRQTQEHLLDEHLRVYPYSCKYCDYKSVSYVNVQTHLRTEHTNENSHILVEPEESVLQMIKTALKRVLKEPLAKSKYQTTKNDQRASGSAKQQTSVKDAKQETSKDLIGDVATIVSVKYVNVNSSPLTQGNNWACKECNFLTPSKRILLKHIYRHLDYKPYSCRICSCLLSYDEIKGHFKEAHPSTDVAIEMIHVTEMEVKVKDMIGKVKKQPLADIKVVNDELGTSDNVSLKTHQETAECSNQSSSNITDALSKTLQETAECSNPSSSNIADALSSSNITDAPSSSNITDAPSSSNITDAPRETLPILVNAKDSITKSGGSYRCPKCKFHSCLRTTVRRHIRSYHRLHHNRINDSEQEIKALNCDICTFVTDDADYLQKHYRMHILKESIGLTQTSQRSTSAFSSTSQGCKKRFTSIKERNLHSESGNYRPHIKICTYPGCGKQFRTQKQCCGHYHASHRKQVPGRLYSCLYVDCKRQFKTVVQRRYHMRTTHRNVTVASKDPTPIFSCLELGCKEKFQTGYERRQHIVKCRKNTQKTNCIDSERPYLCPDPKCDKSYTSYDGRRVHVTRHHKQNTRSLNAKDVCGDLPYNCPAPGCDKQFGRKDKRLHHIALMHKDYVVQTQTADAEKQSEDETMFPCPVPRCPKQYRHVTGCQRHMKKEHQDYKGILVVKAAGEGMLGNAVCPWPDCERAFADLKGLQPHFIQTHGISILVVKAAGEVLLGKAVCPWPDCERAFADLKGLQPHFIQIHGLSFSEYQSKTRKGQQHVSKATAIECETRLTPKKSIDKKSPRTSLDDRSVATDLGSEKGKEITCPWPGCPSSFKNDKGMRLHFFYHGISHSEFLKKAEKKDQLHKSKEKPSPVKKSETSSPNVPAAIISCISSSVHCKPGPACSKSKKNYDKNAINEPSKIKLPESSSSYDEFSDSKPVTDRWKGTKPELSKNTHGNKTGSKHNKPGPAFSKIKYQDSSSSEDEFNDSQPDADNLKGKKPGLNKNTNDNQKGSKHNKPGPAFSKLKLPDSSSSDDEFSDSQPDADSLKGKKPGLNKNTNDNQKGSKHNKPGPAFSKLKLPDSSSSDDEFSDSQPDADSLKCKKPGLNKNTNDNQKGSKHNKPGPAFSKLKLPDSSSSDDEFSDSQPDADSLKCKKPGLNKNTNDNKKGSKHNKPGPAFSKLILPDSSSSDDEFSDSKPDANRLKGNKHGQSKKNHGNKKGSNYDKPGPALSIVKYQDSSSSDDDYVDQKLEIVSAKVTKLEWSSRNKGDKKSPKYHKPGPVSSKRKFLYESSSDSDNDSVEEKPDTVISKQKKHKWNKIDNRKKHSANFSKPGPASSKRKSYSEDSTSSSDEPIDRKQDKVHSKVNTQKWSKMKKTSEKLPKYSKAIPTSSLKRLLESSSSDDEVDSCSSSSTNESKKIISTSRNRASASKKRNSQTGSKHTPRGKHVQHKTRMIRESTLSGSDYDEGRAVETSDACSNDESVVDTKPNVSILHCCHLCPFKNLGKREFARHLACHKVFNIIPSLSCSHCKFKSNEYSILNQHIKLHKDEPLFECHYCSSFQSTVSKDVLVHCEMVHPEQTAAVWGKFDNKIIFKTGFADLEPSLNIINVANGDNLAKTACINDIELVWSPKGVVLYPSGKRSERSQSILYCCHVCSYSTSDRDTLFSHIMKH